MDDRNEFIDNSVYTHYVGIKFNNGARAYFFGINHFEVKEGDKVVVETSRGLELGEVVVAPIDMSSYKSSLGLKPVLRVATPSDIKLYESNLKDAKAALSICAEEIKNYKQIRLLCF